MFSLYFSKYEILGQIWTKVITKFKLWSTWSSLYPSEFVFWEIRSLKWSRPLSECMQIYSNTGKIWYKSTLDGTKKHKETRRFFGRAQSYTTLILSSTVVHFFTITSCPKYFTFWNMVQSLELTLVQWLLSHEGRFQCRPLRVQIENIHHNLIVHS